jgi:hypothetical protein
MAGVHHDDHVTGRCHLSRTGHPRASEGAPSPLRASLPSLLAVCHLPGLGEYADDAEIITSELVTNAVQHVRGNGTETIGVTLRHAGSPAAVTVAVSDSSPEGPVKRDTPAGSERGRGLQIVEALSAHWGWHQQDGGKAIFAVLAREA